MGAKRSGKGRRDGWRALWVASLVLVVSSWATQAWGGGPKGWQPGVEGQQGLRPAAWSADGSLLAVTGWNRAGLSVVPVGGGPSRQLSVERGAGFHPVWAVGGFAFKEVAAGGGGRGVHRVVWADPHTGHREVIETGARLGDPSASRDGLLAWSNGSRVTLRRRLGPDRWVIVGRLELPGYSNLVELDPAGERLAFSDPAGRVGVRELASGRTSWLTDAGAYSHPAWSASGKHLLLRGPAERVHVFDAATGIEVANATGLNPAWLPHAKAIVFERVVRERFRVLSSSLWLLDLEAGRTQPLRGGARQLRFARPSPAGSSLGAVDRQSGELRVTALDREDGLGEAMALLGEAVELDPPPPPPQPDPPPSATVVEVPYLHQLWDTPDDFDGGWSCGPTSCLMVVQKYQKLPDHPISCSWPDPHTSLWGWYVPNEYSFAGYTYDIDGLAKGDVWVKGAHGFICRELGAAYWAYMVDFCNQHGLTSWQAGTSFGALTAEIDAGYPMYASTSVLGYGHIIVLVGYDDDHSIVVNDPYGDANGTWGQYDGEDAVYDWPGYNNGNLEIGLSQLFGAQGPLVPDWAATSTAQSYPAAMLEGSTAQVWVEYQNDGTQSWDPSQSRLGTTEPRDRESAFYDEQSWIGPTRPTAVDAATGPAETGRFSFTLQAPEVDQSTDYTECWGLVEEGLTWFGPPDDEVCFSIAVLALEDVEAPIADAGPDQRLTLGQAASLDGSGSSDADGTIVSWSWATPDGTLSGEQVSWQPSVAGSFQVSLTVTDELGLTDADAVQIEVLPTGAIGGVPSDDSSDCQCTLPDRSVGARAWALAFGVGLLAWLRRRGAVSTAMC